jgi:tRNA A-37 threonylcarbamoyl transferase component Bud32
VLGSPEPTAAVILVVALVSPRRAAIQIAAALVVAAIVNMWMVVPGAETWAGGLLMRTLGHPVVRYAGNGLAAVLAVWGLMRLLGAGSRRERLARAAERRRDYLGAAELYLEEGNRRHALELFQKARAWRRAAELALESGHDSDAAAMLRRAGGRDLAEAARLYRSLGDREAAVRCDRDLAEWLAGHGHIAEAIESWLRAGDPQRALRVARLAIDEGRLRTTDSAFAAARRAARDTHDHQTLARLFEAEGAWRQAAVAWREAGENERAAANFRRAGRLEEAADAEGAAGRPKEAAQLRMQQLREMREQLRLARARGAADTPDGERLKLQIRHETESLISHLGRLGMEREMIEVLRSAGRIEEAVEKLAAADQVAAAAELARDSERWDLAARMLERLGRWGEASDMHEIAGDMEKAAECAERAGEDTRALQLYRTLNRPDKVAHCLARMGSLQDALIELHRQGRLEDACTILRSYPGPVPDIPDIILDMADWSAQHASLEQAIACLQRAVVGVALQPGRLEPAVALARRLHQAGEHDTAIEQLDRVLSYDYSHPQARQLRAQIEMTKASAGLASTQPSGESSARGVDRPTAAQQRYEILTELGRGGMGVVYKARDTRLDRDVAIKVLRTTSPEEAARLEQEAKAAATLNHPGIVTIYDFEAGFDGYFITMEYVPGDPLDMLIRTQPQRVRRHVVAILTRLADAVAYAHSHRVIHRDLKPGNILLTPAEEVKILDFGIAARLDTGSSAGPAVCGTPYYMAPEQIRGQDTTPATDIYAFGATSFHLATGRPPFAEGNVIEAHLKEQPPDPAVLMRDLPPGLGPIILRCLAKEPSERYASASELREALIEIQRR